MRIENYLDDLGVDYISEGKNVSSGWIEINCPFCGQDPSKHLGINLETGLFHSWCCNETGNLVKLDRA